MKELKLSMTSLPWVTIAVMVWLSGYVWLPGGWYHQRLFVVLILPIFIWKFRFCWDLLVGKRMYRVIGVLLLWQSVCTHSRSPWEFFAPFGLVDAVMVLVLCLLCSLGVQEMHSLRVLRGGDVVGTCACFFCKSCGLLSIVWKSFYGGAP